MEGRYFTYLVLEYLVHHVAHDSDDIDRFGIHGLRSRRGHNREHWFHAFAVDGSTHDGPPNQWLAKQWPCNELGIADFGNGLSQLQLEMVEEL